VSRQRAEVSIIRRILTKTCEEEKEVRIHIRLEQSQVPTSFLVPVLV
jgi:hypothetical protein